jgi:lipopolysaccharide transport system ATP-binding protein
LLAGIAAGDANFMEKAKKRMMSLIAQSKILILASHDLHALQSICTRGLVFHQGNVIFDGDINCAIAECQNRNGII